MGSLQKGAGGADGKTTMFVRVLLTVGALAGFVAAIAVVDCAIGFVALLDGDPLRVCSSLGPLAEDHGLWLGVALGMVGVVAFVAALLPRSGRARPGRQEIVEATLVQNLSRLETVSTTPGETTSGSDSHAFRLTKRLETVVAALEGDTAGSREATQQWIRLLQEANDLHNRGELTTEDFKTVNTSLLAVFAAGDDRGLAVSSSSVTPQDR